MSISVQGTKFATRPGLTTSFEASGGVAPYTYSLAQGQVAGGTIDPSSGLYTAPARVPEDPRSFYDYIIATDSTGAQSPGYGEAGNCWISVGHCWQLVAEIYRHELGLPLGRVFLFDQKVDLPEDNRPFVVISIPGMSLIGSGIKPNGTFGTNGLPGWDQQLKWAQINYHMDIHLYSRDMDGLNRLPAMFMAASGLYSRQVQQENGFYISTLPRNVVNLSGLDGAAIPYHYIISIEAFYTNQWTTGSEYFDDFQNVQLVVSEN